MKLKDMPEKYIQELKTFSDMKMNRNSRVIELEELYEDLYLQTKSSLQDEVLNAWLDDSFEDLNPRLLEITSHFEAFVLLDRWSEQISRKGIEDGM